jgi:hypothetical protein
MNLNNFWLEPNPFEPKRFKPGSSEGSNWFKPQQFEPGSNHFGSNHGLNDRGLNPAPIWQENVAVQTDVVQTKAAVGDGVV